MKMKEKYILIDIKDKDTTAINKEVMNLAIDSFLEDNPKNNISEIIYGDSLSKVFLEILNNDTTNVKNKDLLYDILEKIYDHWRSVKRYIISDQNNPRFEELDFLTLFDKFTEALLGKYRELCFKLTGKKFTVYRQLPAFANAFLLTDSNSNYIYKELESAKVITKIAFRTPFVSYSASNKRTGIFEIINANPIDGLNLSNKKWFLIPILCGKSRIHVCISERYISLGVSLSNLFQFDDDFKNSKPDGIILFGSNTIDGIYYDKEKDIYIGSLKERDEIDYFGYLKKIILTVHNIKMIENGKLPIHGAGISIKLNDTTTKNVIIVGDSGAGKSETIEALRLIANGQIQEITTIYDDMGYFEIIDNQIYTSGTEIGAFVRTDDLENDYVYKVFDRAIFLNPKGKNARLVLPVSTYKEVSNKYHVDYVFYANNYKNSKEKIHIFKQVEDALLVFKEGKRFALGTTGEKGLVQTFFANPFGPIQLENTTNSLLETYFQLLFNNNIPIGELFTGLGLENGKDNPKYAARHLIELLIK